MRHGGSEVILKSQKRKREKETETLAIARVVEWLERSIAG